MKPRQFVALATLSGTVALAGWDAARLISFHLSDIENTATGIEDRAAPRDASSFGTDVGPVDASPPTASVSAAAGATPHLELSEPAAVAVAEVPAAGSAPSDPPAAASAPVAVAGVPTAASDPSDPPAVAPAPVAEVPTLASDPSDPPAVAPAAKSVVEVAAADSGLPQSVFVLAGTSAAEMPAAEAPVAETPAAASDPAPLPETRARLVSLFRSESGEEELRPAVRPVETPNECLVAEICIDDYLWSLYERTPKVDTNKVQERIKATVKKKGKTRTVTKIVTKYVIGDFTWKDPIAAQRAGMSLKDYVIGGMDRGFRLKLYRALHTIDEAGFMPGITSAFRDDYRQSIAAGNKAASDSSYHGGSRRGGYGHGLAADLVSVKGATRMQRYVASEELWKWIDVHEKDLGIGRPYLDRDPPHVGPIDGKEYAVKRGRTNVQKADLHTKKTQTAKLEAKKPALAARHDAGPAKRAKPAKLEAKKHALAARHDPGPAKRAKPAKSRLSDLRIRASVQR